MDNALDSLLRAEGEQLETEETALRESIRGAQERLTVVQHRLEHVRALLAEEAPSSLPSNKHQIQRSQANSRGDICDIAEAVLSERNRNPMYYKDLALEVTNRGGELGGARPAATLTARLVRDPRFVRPTTKGYYALRRDYPTARNVGARRHRRRTG